MIDTSSFIFPKNQTRKRRKRHPPSIICPDKKRCYLCGKRTNTEEHHIFGGSNRHLSEEYGLKVYLCRECHQDGRHAAHKDAETASFLHQLGQQAFEERYSREEFIRIFGRNYL